MGRKALGIDGDVLLLGFAHDPTWNEGKVERLHLRDGLGTFSITAQVNEFAILTTMSRKRA
jgi:hypothetical protein